MSFIHTINQRIKHALFGRKLQLSFLEDLSSLINDGVPAAQAIETIGHITTGAMREMTEDITRCIAAGKPLADGMIGWFPQTIVEIIRTGEEGGSLAETINASARALGQQSSAMASLLNSTLYPVAVISMALGVSVFIKRSVLGSFENIKPLSTWPDIGQTLYHLASFVESWWWLVLVGLVVGLFLLLNLLRNMTGKARLVIDHIPLIRLYRDTIAARLMETLGLLITNGIVLNRALALMQSKATPYLTWHLGTMELRLSGGRDNIADVLDTGLLSRPNILRLRVIAKGKGFEHALIRLGKQAAERNAKTIMTTGKLVGGVALAAGAGLAAFIIFAIYAVGSFVGS